MVKTVTEQTSIDYLLNPGDYCFDTTGRVIMACPECTGVFLCQQSVSSRSPLTLEPSVVGPPYAKEARSMVVTPCLHHFWVKDGKVIPA